MLLVRPVSPDAMPVATPLKIVFPRVDEREFTPVPIVLPAMFEALARSFVPFDENEMADPPEEEL